MSLIANHNTAIARSNNNSTLEKLMRENTYVEIPEGTYFFDVGLLIPSNTHLKGNGRVILSKGTERYSDHLIRTGDTPWTTAYQVGTDDRVTNITLENIIFDGCDATGPDHLVVIGNVDNFRMRDCTFATGLGTFTGSGTGTCKYAIEIMNCTDVRCYNTTFVNTYSDGFHISGNTTDVLIDGVFGKCNDNVFGCTIANYAIQEYYDAAGDPIRGNQERFIFRNIFLEGDVFEPIRLIGQGESNPGGGENWGFYDILIDGVFIDGNLGDGVGEAHIVALRSSPSGGEFATADGGQLTGASFNNICVKNLKCRIATASNSLVSVNTDSGGAYGLTLSDSEIDSTSTTGAGWLRIRSGVVENATVERCAWESAAGNGVFVDDTNGTTATDVKSLTIRNCRHTSGSDGTYMFRGEGSVENLIVEGNEYMEGQEGLVSMIGSTGSNHVTVRDNRTSFASGVNATMLSFENGDISNLLIEGGDMEGVTGSGNQIWLKATNCTVATTTIVGPRVRSYNDTIVEASGGSFTLVGWFGGSYTDILENPAHNGISVTEYQVGT